MDTKSVAIHSQLITCTASEVAAMIEGAMHHHVEATGVWTDDTQASAQRRGRRRASLPGRRSRWRAGGQIVAEYFDIGQSRSVPWARRAQAARLLAALKDRDRGWGTIVVGEGTRCWFGNQFSLIAPRFAAYGVDL